MPQFDQGHALVIGVGDYDVLKGFPSLPSTVRDAQKFSDVLMAPYLCAYPERQVTTLTGEHATITAMRNALKQLARNTNKDSTVVIYFSGHGGRNWSKTSGWQTYLCPRDANIADLNKTAISRDEFSSLLEKIPARKMLVILDSCYAAGAVQIKSAQTEQRPIWKSGVTQREIERLAAGNGRVVLAASLNDEVAFSSENHLSLFTTHLIDGLQSHSASHGDGLIRVFDLFTYITETVAQAFPSQTPILHAAHLDMNFPIALYQGGTKGAASGATRTARQSEDGYRGRAQYDAAPEQVHTKEETTNVQAGGTYNKVTDNIFNGENLVIGVQNRNTYNTTYEHNPGSSTSRPARLVRLTRTRNCAQQAGGTSALYKTLDELEQELQKGPNASVEVMKHKLLLCQRFPAIHRSAIEELNGLEPPLPEKLRSVLMTML